MHVHVYAYHLKPLTTEPIPDSSLRRQASFLELLQRLQFPILWSHIPDMAIVSHTSNRPQHEIGSYLGPCLMYLQVGLFWNYLATERPQNPPALEAAVASLERMLGASVRPNTAAKLQGPAGVYLPGGSYVVPCWVVCYSREYEKRSHPTRNYIGVSRYV